MLQVQYHPQVCALIPTRPVKVPLLGILVGVPIGTVVLPDWMTGRLDIVAHAAGFAAEPMKRGLTDTEGVTGVEGHFDAETVELDLLHKPDEMRKEMMAPRMDQGTDLSQHHSIDQDNAKVSRCRIEPNSWMLIGFRYLVVAGHTYGPGEGVAGAS